MRAAALALLALAACGSPKKDAKKDDKPEAARDAAPATPARTWPADAPAPTGACTRHDECAVIRWDGPWPPDPCCDQRVAFTPVLRSYLVWFDAYRKEHCGGVQCPSAPLPGAEPACCVVLARCVEGKCVQSCDDPTFKPPAEHSLDPNCNEGAIMPEPPPPAPQ
ncbi:MAG TPA: hypothetical protein VMZ28_01570 [Kofleriaceae bacterium]|nr:hypothetical protein [Kofleriaceae bacterium]